MEVHTSELDPIWIAFSICSLQFKIESAACLVEKHELVWYRLVIFVCLLEGLLLLGMWCQCVVKLKLLAAFRVAKSNPNLI